MTKSWVQSPNPVYQVEYGQDSDGALVFAIKITGMPATPNSPQDEARHFCALLEQVIRAEDGGPVSVHVFEDAGKELH